MKSFTRLMIVLVTITLPCRGYSGDDRFDAPLPLTAFRLTQMLQTFIERYFPRRLLNIEEIKVWSFNRDHHSSDGWSGPDEQTVDGVLTVSARLTLLDTVPCLQFRSLKSLALETTINSYLSSVLPSFTEYFRSHFNPDKDYYLGQANLNRNQLSAAAVDGPDDSDDNHSASSDKDEASEKNAGAGVIREKCQCYGCLVDNCNPVIDAPESWKAHLVSDRKKNTITYKASLLYSGFLKPPSMTGPGVEQSPEKNNGDEDESEEEEDQIRQCIDLYRGGLDKGLSKHLTPESE